MTQELPESHVRLKRVYEPAAPEDGVRVLVDRLWPRGLRKADAPIDRWMKDIAPSTQLRQWFGHDPERWPEFRRRYTRELQRLLSKNCSDWPGVARLHWSSRRTMKRTTMQSCCAMRFCSHGILKAQLEPAREEQHMSDKMYPPTTRELAQQRRELAPAAQAAQRAGATPQELMEAIWVAAEIRAGGAYAHSVLMLDTLNAEPDRR